MSIIISRYKVTVKEEAEYAHETFEERKKRVLQSRAGITVTYVLRLSAVYMSHECSFQLFRPIRVPLMFTKRD